MTLWGRNKNLHPLKWDVIRRDTYLITNIFLAGVIILIFIYSGIFSPAENNYPIVCVHERITGQPCISCGLSHSFSLILRGRIAEANSWNIYGLRIFLFFFSQLLLRFLFSYNYLTQPDFRSQQVMMDIFISVIMFLIAFMPYLLFIINSFLSLF